MADYTPPTSGLSDWQLKLSYFYVSNKLLLRKLLTLLLILINCALWGYSIFGFVVWAIDYQRLTKQTQGLMFSSAEVLPTIEAIKPQALSLSGVQAFSGNGNLYDLMADVVNPNAGWLATFKYAFISNNASTTYFSSFVLPGQRKILLDLGKQASDGQLEISDIKWQKVTDFNSIKNIRERFAVENDEFIPAAKEGDPSQVRFTIKNESSYSYWEAGIVVLLYNGGSIAGVNYLTIPQFKSGDKRLVEMNWIKALPRIDSIEIIPEVNYLNPDNLMAPASS